MAGIRFALFADLMLVLGLAAFLLYALRPAEREDPRILSGLIAPQPWLCGLALLASFGGMLSLTANMQGIAVGDIGLSLLASMVADTDVGKAWVVRMLALVVATAAAIQLDRRPVPAATALSATSAIALASLVWSGHAAAGEGLAGTGHRIADALHMIAAGVWIGAIAAFLILLRPTADCAQQARTALAAHSLAKFTRVGTICVLGIAATGLINLQMITGIGRIPNSPYGHLLVAKLALFGIMLALAALNRWRLSPALEAADNETSIGAIRRSLAMEASAAAAILALVAVLGMLEP